MTAEEVVVAFIVNLGVCLRALRTEFGDISRADVATPLTGLRATGERTREGRIQGLGSYQFHGYGCRVEMDTGEEIDFDWLPPDGAASFDGWRLQAFVESLEADYLGTREELLGASSHLVDTGHLIEVQRGWFTVARQP